MYLHFTENRLLTEKQSGYRRHHSTQHQLLYLTHNLYKSLDDGRDFTAIYLDISKYFDKIWHVGLIQKCKYEFGITGTLLDWIESCLYHRQQRIIIQGVPELSEHIFLAGYCYCMATDKRMAVKLTGYFFQQLILNTIPSWGRSMTAVSFYARSITGIAFFALLPNFAQSDHYEKIELPCTP